MFGIHEIQQELTMFERASAIIKDGRKLSFEYVPEKLVHREEQMHRLETLFRPMVTDGIPCSAFLTGSVGTGKTVTAKRFCENMAKHCASNSKQMDHVFINCRIRNTEHGVIIQLIRHFDPGFPDRGFSADEMLRSLKRHIESGSRPFVIILDEVDVLLKSSSKNLIYQLSRFTDEMRGNSSISLIMISQEHISEMLDDASISSFKRANTIKFDRYSKDELKDIVKARAEEALVSGVMDDDVMGLLADIGKDYGDARLVIEMLEKAANIAEGSAGGTITADDVRSANAMIYSNVSENKLMSLDLKRKLALLSIARAIKSDTYISITRAEKTYAVVCEEYGQTARKHTQFWTYVQDMEKMNILDTVVKSEAEGGRVTYISIPNIPPKELARKLENLLDSPTSNNECGF
ncbi:MAG: AAA family ATPase [Candidatus Methanoplasma sp.]|jgi:cell division control protein 6|nr:AAA family ATPase [Candidatus Methanoplasma sp.]